MISENKIKIKPEDMEIETDKLKYNAI